MSLTALLSHWRAEPTIAGNVVEWRSLAGRAARTAPFPNELHATLRQSLESHGIHTLYSHQAIAWQHVQAGRNPVIVTGTASGKTLAYNLPVLDCLLRDPEARALYLFPTKALAQDQLVVLREQLLAASQIPTSIYDGDTPSRDRPTIRKKARLVCSNPDMLHAGILPHHTAWVDFFRHLRFIVIDEMHVYRGVFGSHVANVIRRMKRVARFYGAKPQFILTSATITNPLELAERLIEEPAAVVDEDGSARGPRHFLIYNPPVVDRDLGIRRSSLLESARLTEDLLTYNVQTIIFGRTRRAVELILTYLRTRTPTIAPDEEGLAKPEDNGETVRGYRSGYLPLQRRQIERGLRAGEVRAVIATTALELGIDIGGMGAAVLSGYPGTIAATWQQAGRAGRGNDPSLAVMVASANPIDQFLAHHPDYFFGRSPEQALINPDNLLILLDHLRCAAFELPFRTDEDFGRVPAARVAEFLAFLHQTGVLHHSGNKYFWMADQYPAEGISLRSASANRVVLQTIEDDADNIGRPTTIGEVDIESASWMVHPEAIYLHEAQTYIVEDLDLTQNIAHLRRQEVDYYTTPQSETTIQLLEISAQAAAEGATKTHGQISVTTQVVGYRKVKWFTHEHLGREALSLPPSQLQTTGYWLMLADGTVDVLREEGLWTNAPNQYGSDWDRLRAEVRARDGFRCQLCGVRETDRAHDVHHKIPFRAFRDEQGHLSPAQANQLTNLITLCPPCHHRVETASRVRSGLAGLGYVLGNLAPLFLMCDARDLGVHSDPQSPLGEGKPTVVLFDKVPAGIGFSERLFELHAELLGRARQLVAACECVEGCPSCVGPAGENGVGGKRETLAILEKIGGKA